ncbi:MAG: hypothetical protein ACYC9M_14285 [Desulfobulbaceae bacterium]
MAMSPRILLFSAIGISLYLGLSLYHGHQLKKYPDLQPGAGKGLSARAEEKTWVQVSTTKQVTAGPVQPQGVQGQPEGGSEEAPAPGAYGDSPPAAAIEQQQLGEKATATDEPQAQLAALQADLLRSRTLLRNREEELRQARLLLDRAREEQQQAIAGARKWREELAPAGNEKKDQLIATDQLQAELKEARARAAIAEAELERARLKAEAMFRYGQEQSRLLAPSRHEAESLKTRLQETQDKLRQAEQQVADLSHREQQLRKELADLRGAGPEAQATAAPAGGAGEPRPGAERAD